MTHDLIAWGLMMLVPMCMGIELAGQYLDWRDTRRRQQQSIRRPPLVWDVKPQRKEPTWKR